MGGSVFITAGEDGSPALHVPRMPPYVFIKLRDKYSNLLSKLFDVVVCPPEAPEKLDHGDIDFLAYGSTRASAWTVEEIADVIGATRYQGSNHMNFAVPWPDDEISKATENVTVYAQIDLVVTESVEQVQWQAFIKSYSIVGSVINTTVRRYGLIPDDKGLNLRVKEAEESGMGRQQSRILLTSEVCIALDFLGYDLLKFKNGFQNETDLFNWLISTSLFKPQLFLESCNSSSNTAFRNIEYESSHEDKATPSLSQSAMTNRGIFRRFRDCFVPSLESNNTGHTSEEKIVPTREEMVDLALEYFSIQEPYDQKIKEAADLKTEAEAKSRLITELSRRFSEETSRVVMKRLAKNIRRNRRGLQRDKGGLDGERHTMTASSNQLKEGSSTGNESKLTNWASIAELFGNASVAGADLPEWLREYFLPTGGDGANSVPNGMV